MINGGGIKADTANSSDTCSTIGGKGRCDITINGGEITIGSKGVAIGSYDKATNININGGTIKTHTILSNYPLAIGSNSGHGKVNIKGGRIIIDGGDKADIFRFDAGIGGTNIDSISITGGDIEIDAEEQAFKIGASTQLSMKGMQLKYGDSASTITTEDPFSTEAYLSKKYVHISPSTLSAADLVKNLIDGKFVVTNESAEDEKDGSIVLPKESADTLASYGVAIEYSTTGSEPWTELTTVSDGAISLTGLQPGSYYLRIRENESSVSEAIEITINAGHKHTHVPIGEAKEATCTEDGMTAGDRCDVEGCGKVFTPQAPIPASHKWENIGRIEPTYDQVGYEYAERCTVCGEILGHGEIPKLSRESYFYYPSPSYTEPEQISDDGESITIAPDETPAGTPTSKTYDLNTKVEELKSKALGSSKVYVADCTIEEKKDAVLSGGIYVDKEGKTVTNSFVKTKKGYIKYTDENGKCVKNSFIVVAGSEDVILYHTNKDGVIQKDKVFTDGDNKFYASKDGSIAMGVFVTDSKGKLYYATEDGSLEKGGIFKVGGKRYYAQSNSVIPKNKLITDAKGKQHYATEDGSFAVSKWIIKGNKKYWCNKNGNITKVKDL